MTSSISSAIARLLALALRAEKAGRIEIANDFLGMAADAYGRAFATEKGESRAGRIITQPSRAK